MQLDDHISSIYFIGDVHAQHTKLEALLTEIDFDDTDPDSECKTAKLVFIGDLIDNKQTNNDQHIITLQRVQSLQKNGHALCLLGNHEFNAIGWASKNENGEFCRPHNEKNTKQHRAFLNAVGEGSAEHNRWIDWFKSLPLFLSFETVNAIHACWDEQAIERLKPYLNADNSLKEVHWVDAFNEQHELFELCEILLKGPERTLPDGEFFIDKTGTKRTQERVKWWQEYQGDKPVVIGHYTLNELPEPLTHKVVCVDYNAAKDDNVLVAYRVDTQLDADNEQLFGGAR
ncbi:metallophosphoesterase [Psychromonas sp. MME2]|uniref:metallophosphoesterase n=1 Tax=Psychromonas sp. MME2 TaxID=3231033 RepID=UPI00339CD715